MLNRIHHGGKQHFCQSKQQRSLVIFCPSFPFHQTIAICKGHLFHLFETGTNLQKTVVLNGSPKTGLDSNVRYSQKIMLWQSKLDSFNSASLDDISIWLFVVPVAPDPMPPPPAWHHQFAAYPDSWRQETGIRSSNQLFA